MAENPLEKRSRKTDDWSLKDCFEYTECKKFRGNSEKMQSQSISLPCVFKDDIDILREKLIEDIDEFISNETELIKTQINVPRHLHYIEAGKLIRLFIFRRFGVD